MITALGKLGLSPRFTLMIAMGILFGGLINIPVRKIERKEPMRADPLQMFGLSRWMDPSSPKTRYTVLSVNVGGCLIPAALALYEIVRLANQEFSLLMACLVATAVNVWICYAMAQPIPNIGIAMSPFVPALTAVLSAYLLAPANIPSVAFVAGVLGPLIGADLLNLGEIEKISAGNASIGGAGTFDGIVLSGLMAVLLA